MKTGTQNTVFCELPVIEQIMSDYWKTREDPEVEDITTSQLWYSFISKYCELILDIEKSEFIELAESNKFAMRLLKNSVSGGSKIIHWVNHLDEIKQNDRFEDFPTALFLLDRSANYCNQLIGDYGLIFLNGNNYKSFTEKLFLLTDIQVKINSAKSDINSWNDFRRLSHPMNSLILTDNFIFTDKEDINSNLMPLLNAFLPEKLSKCNFQLMIITRETVPPSFPDRYSEILKQLKKINRNYQIEVSLIPASIGKNHDRRIFTNYCMLESNNSFTYFNKQGNIKKNTTLHLFPSFLIVTGKELMLNKNLNTLSEVKEIVANSGESKGSSLGVSNRLLTLVTK